MSGSAKICAARASKWWRAAVALLAGWYRTIQLAECIPDKKITPKKNSLAWPNPCSGRGLNLLLDCAAALLE